MKKIIFLLLIMGFSVKGLYADQSAEMFIQYVQPYADNSGNYLLEIGTKQADDPTKSFKFTFISGTSLSTPDIGKSLLSVALSAMSTNTRVRMNINEKFDLTKRVYTNLVSIIYGTYFVP